jgi:hypothetical protein
MLLALTFLPAETPRESRPVRRLRDLTLAGIGGLATGALAFAMLTRAPAFDPISAFHLAQSKPGAGGTNAVNTIIVDFRGYDTFGEIIVLSIAALVIFALSETLLSSPAVARLPCHPAAARGIRRPPPDDAGHHHPAPVADGDDGGHLPLSCAATTCPAAASSRAWSSPSPICCNISPRAMTGPRPASASTIMR